LRFLLRPIFVLMLCTLSPGIRCLAQATGEDKVPLQQRVWIACQVYSLTNTYFAHWRALPELHLDKEFQAYGKIAFHNLFLGRGNAGECPFHDACTFFDGNDAVDFKAGKLGHQPTGPENLHRVDIGVLP